MVRNSCYAYKILIVRDSGFWKNKTITESNKTFLYVKYSYEEKSKVLINKRKITGLKYFNDPKVFIENSNTITIFVKPLKNTIQIKKRKILIVFCDMIADMLSNEKLNPRVIQLFIRGRKLTFILFLLHNLILLFPKILN